MGSDSQPPCEEGVERIIMMNHLKISASLLRVLSKKSSNKKIETEGNSRMI